LGGEEFAADASRLADKSQETLSRASDLFSSAEAKHDFGSSLYFKALALLLSRKDNGNKTQK